MCDRHHQPEPYTLGGMQIIICDDIPEGGIAYPPSGLDEYPDTTHNPEDGS